MFWNHLQISKLDKIERCPNFLLKNYVYLVSSKAIDFTNDSDNALLEFIHKQQNPF